ncbi:MAG: hypothetical protein V3S48_01785 [Candidatus Neomarinimicrobiota bacterium]
MFNYLEYFISAYGIVLGLIAAWFIFQIKAEYYLTAASQEDTINKEF